MILVIRIGIQTFKKKTKRCTSFHFLFSNMTDYIIIIIIKIIIIAFQVNIKIFLKTTIVFDTSMLHEFKDF